MVNGEKTNPVPIESALRGSPCVSDAVVFGASRSQIGALIILGETVPTNLSQSELVNLLRPVMEQANADAPSHSQLSPETLVFLPFSTVLPRADKGSFLRPKVYSAFENVIEGVYKRLEGEVVDGEEKREIETLDETVEYVTDVIKSMLDGNGGGLEMETDLFDFGLDSLQAGRIRNRIQRVRPRSFAGKDFCSCLLFDIGPRP